MTTTPGTRAEPTESARRSLVFILPTLHGGGAERVVLTILRHLDRRRFDLVLAVLDTRDPAYLSELPSDVTFVDLRCRSVRRAVPAIWRLVWKLRPDVVFSVIAHLNLAMALIKPFFPRGVRVIARETAVLSHSFRGKVTGAVWYAAYRWFCRQFDHVICQSEAMRTELVEEFGLPPDRARVIPNPVDIELVTRLAAEALPEAATLMRSDRAGDVHLVAAGRLSEEKGFDLLLAAMAVLDTPQICLTILGDGPLRAALEAQARNLGVSARLQFVGFQANPYAFFARAHALVLSSRSEAFPNVVLEALACGTPVIATPTPGGLLELLQDRADCVVADELTAASLARAIASYPFHQRTNRRIGRLDEYSAERVGKQYSAVFAAFPPIPRPARAG